MLFLIFLLTSTLHILTVKSDLHVTVRPTDSHHSICGDRAPCDTLSNLLANRPAIFTNRSDLSLNFLNGTHEVNYPSTQIKLGIKRKVIWHGENAVIICQTGVIFAFNNTENLEIRGLTFQDCGNGSRSEEPTLLNVSAALFLSNVGVFHCKGVTVTHSKGYGLLIFNQLGSAQIQDSFFSYNNKNCKPDSTNPCVGGNIALYFLNQVNALETTKNISITNCIIKDGNDLSITTQNCKNGQNEPSSATEFRANGLTVVFAQKNYQVQFLVNNTKFSYNDGNHKHPAILVHDHSEVRNKVEFYFSTFKSESTFLVFVNTRNLKISSELLTIRNCSFSNGTATPVVHIYAKSTTMSDHTAHYQVVKIVNCKFDNYGFWLNHAHPTEAMVKVSYDIIENKTSLNLLTEIHSCSFFDNNVNVSLINMSVIPTIKSKSSDSSLITVKNTTFESTKHYGPPIVFIEGPQKSDIFWKYGNVSTKETNTADFTNCQFKMNFKYFHKHMNKNILKVRNSRIVLRNCIIFNSKGTAVYAEKSIIIIDGSNKFNQNQGRFGGALHLNQSLMLIMPNARTHFYNNSACYGGGIFATPIESKLNKTHFGIYSLCTIIKTMDLYRSTGREQIVLEKNEADFGGNSIYGGRYVNCTYNCTGRGKCQVLPDTIEFDGQQLPQYINIPYSNNSYKEVSSPADKICLCEDNMPTNSCTRIERTVFPGQVFNVSLIAMGEMKGSTAVIVTAKPNYFTFNIDNRLHFFPAKCETFNYSVHRRIKHDRKVTVKLRISGGTPKPVRLRNPSIFEIDAELSSCPNGLDILMDGHACECSHFIKKFDMVCDIERGMIHIKDKQWIRFYKNLKTGVTASYPLDYLNTGSKYVNLNEPDKQCNFNRSGILCGACRANFSVVIGSSNCKECSNVYLLLIIPFALAGVALVVLLLKCNLTVSVGHINGIIFYANIVQVNKALLFTQKGVVYEIFSTFISWLNLDLGIETCFFANMDTYAKVCLQFVFPVYLWIIVGLIILAAHCSSRMGRLIGDNSVPVLATLLLLSYAKLLRVIIATVAFAYIDFEDGTRIAVWLHDGNVEYLHSKHIALFLIAILFLFTYILPLIFLVLLAPCLQAWSHHRGFRWVNRLKPFLDAYQGPYNDKFRFWTGLLLLARLVLFVVYTANFKNDFSMSFFWTIAITALLIAVLLRKSVYRHQIANRIELLCLFNIMILCSVNWLTNKTIYEEWTPIGPATTYTSVAVIILTFLFIILYQQTRLYTFVCSKLHKPRKQGVRTHGESTVSVPTSSVVELEESNQLKEPLLDSD